ncbi:MAG: GNAT family N-acetyltransferase, partial [Myxococcales bacterium]|nr:GNAT family N-acetyltransferase [Myxococcales bacterium]
MSGGGGERAVIVRPAREADVPALGRLAAALVAFHVAIDPLRFMNIENAEVGYGRWLGKESADPEALVLVAEREGAVVGYAYARLEPKSYNEL